MEQVDAREIYPQLRRIHVFSQLREEDAACLGKVRLVRVAAHSAFYRQGEQVLAFWGVVEGEVCGVVKKEEDGSNGYPIRYAAGDSFGEVQLLLGLPATVEWSEVASDSTLVAIDEEGFWRLLASCPVVRRAVLANLERRLQHYQTFAVHREKLMALGTLSAGLMHELNNPGTAARRAAAQLRQNLVQLQQLSLRFCEVPMAKEQMVCMRDLQMRAMEGEKPPTMNTVEQSDAEESLGEWLDAAGVENSWKIAPALTATGLSERDLDCAQQAFPDNSGPASFSDALNWLVSLVSSMQLVETIEESITRVSELVMAVKKYSHNENAAQIHPVDVHDGLRSTLTILGHKFRPKNLKIEKAFAANLPVVQSRGAGLNQVWTNLLDNAIDASPEGGTIRIRTWAENGNVAVGIADQGPGIPEEHRKHIFDPFFTTKPVGVGTGLGLDIAHRIVGSYGGEIGFTSQAEETEFVVKVPIEHVPVKQVLLGPAAVASIAQPS
jgi:signal transduction histidine kinase